MKITLKNGTILDVVDVEESYYPRTTQGMILSIRLNSEEGIADLKDIFTAEALESITVGEGEDGKVIAGYTQVESIRKLYNGNADYDTAVDLAKRAD